MSSEKRTNVGIIGYGSSATTFHIPFINVLPELRLYSLMQPRPHPDKNPAKDFPNVLLRRSVQDMLDDPSLEVVVIATPPDTHLSLARSALESGKHVIVEKPFTSTLEEAKSLVNMANAKRRHLTVFQNRRFDADYVTLSKLIKSGTLGRIVEFETHFDSYRPEYSTDHAWKNKPLAGGGAIYDLGTHLVDQIYHLFGMPKGVTCFLGSHRAKNPTGYEDSFTLLLTYSSGLLATAKVSAVSAEEKQLRFWVRGETGSYKKYHRDIQEEQLKAGMRPGDPGFGEEPSDRYGVLSKYEDGKITSSVHPTVSPAPTYAEFYRQIAPAIANERDVPVPPADSCQVMRLIELAIISARTEETQLVD